jgi:hypothetical protein
MEQTESKTTKDYINQTLTQTNTAITNLFDTVDNIDRKFYGRRMKFFIWGCILVLMVAPLLDELLGVKQDIITYFSTLVFLIFVLTIVLAFVGAWRDDTGNWTWHRAKSRLQTYYETYKDQLQTTKTNSQDENLYKLGQYLFFGGVAWKAIQNLSVFVRKPIEGLFSTRLTSLRNFERFTAHYYWVALALGVAVIAYLYNKNPQIVERIKNELRQLFGSGSDDTKYKVEVVKISQNTNTDLVINPKRTEHVAATISTSNSVLFTDFVTAIQNWNPRQADYEYEYQDRLYRHLRKHLPDANIEMEYPIGENFVGSRGRADIVVNDTILIEMKRDSSAGAIQRAKGQISQYSEIWKDKGPVILLLCDYDFEKARLAFTPTMNDLAQLKRPALTIVARAKGENLPLTAHLQ